MEVLAEGGWSGASPSSVRSISCFCYSNSSFYQYTAAGKALLRSSRKRSLLTFVLNPNASLVSFSKVSPFLVIY